MTDPKSKIHADDASAAGEEDGPDTGQSAPGQPSGPIAAPPPDGIAQDEAALGNEGLLLVAETSEGHQELSRRTTTDPGELRREVGAVLRLPEGNYIDPGDIDFERRDDETMIINMGP